MRSPRCPNRALLATALLATALLATAPPAHARPKATLPPDAMADAAVLGCGPNDGGELELRLRRGKQILRVVLHGRVWKALVAGGREASLQAEDVSICSSGACDNPLVRIRFSRAVEEKPGSTLEGILEWEGAEGAASVHFKAVIAPDHRRCG